MLELRPSCEHCNKPLPADSTEALICSYECTFCVTCVETLLRANACPNCGGGFVQRPVRPAQEWKAGNFLGNDPASKTFKHRPVNLEAYAKLVAAIAGLPPEKR
ncbi:MAG: DUF1272 domain-containing protein [Polaromonas sp.]|nr:DUF1272 domain-containing protein [Polaromonas sp.]